MVPDHPGEFEALIQAGKDSPHRALTPKVLAEIWQRGRSQVHSNDPREVRRNSQIEFKSQPEVTDEPET